MNIIEISEKFPTELHATQFFEHFRWGKNKVRCVYCDSKKVSRRKKDLRYKCYRCNNSFNVTVNTALHDTRLPLKTWLYAFSLITDAKKGLSTLQLKRNLNISYPTAFRMYHKIRSWMNEENKTLPDLNGIVEMDETIVGGKPRKFATGKSEPPKEKVVIPKLDKKIKMYNEVGISFKGGRGNPAKPDLKPKRGKGKGATNPIVGGIVERDGNVIAEVVKNTTYNELKKLVNKYVDKDDTLVITDEGKGYNQFSKMIEHIAINHKRIYSYKGVNTNSIESFWAIIKRGIIGQYHSVSSRHLPNYIAEFVFKYNNRKDDTMFETLVRNAMNNKN